jgi:methenyltetrahydromethanopterin cyclohydrolase
MGDLGRIDIVTLDLDKFWWPGVQVTVRQPAIACMAAQYAGWVIKNGKFFAMGSGPARSLYHREAIFEEIGYRDNASSAVIVLEGNALPDKEVAQYIAEKTKVDPKHLYMIIAPTSSLVGCVQISARIVETSLHKMLELGFDIEKVAAGTGLSPIAPVAKDELQAIGKTNDCILYGGKVYLYVQVKDSSIEKILDHIPSSSSPDYGKRFYEIFQAHGGDFYKVDPLLFAPAEIVINNIATGSLNRAGALNSSILRQSLMGDC